MVKCARCEELEAIVVSQSALLELSTAAMNAGGDTLAAAAAALNDAAELGKAAIDLIKAVNIVRLGVAYGGVTMPDWLRVRLIEATHATAEAMQAMTKKEA